MTPRPEPKRQDTSQVLSYYFHPTDDHDVYRRTPANAPTDSAPNRRLAIVEVDAPSDVERHHLALVGPPATAPPARSGNTSPRDVGIVGGSFTALMDRRPLPSLAPLPAFQPSEKQTTPVVTPAIGESKQIDVKVAPPVMTRLSSQDDWLTNKPASPTKPLPTPAGPRGAPPPRPPRLHSPPPRASPVSLSSAASSISGTAGDPVKLVAPSGIVRGNSDYSIFAVSDTSASERNTPISRPPSPAKPPASASGSSHRREGAFPAHSVFTAQSNSISGDGLPSTDSLTDERSFYLADRSPLRVVGEPEPESDEDDGQVDHERTPNARKNTITSRSSRTQTTTSSLSHYTQSSGSHYTSSNVSRKNTQHKHEDIHSGEDDMEDLIATVGTALADLGVNPADVPPPTVFPPPDESKPSRPASTDGHGTRSSPMSSAVNLVHSNNSPRTSARNSPRTNAKDITRGSPRTSVSDLARGSPRPGSIDFPRSEARGSPRTSMTEIQRGSPRPSLRGDVGRPGSLLGSRSGSRSGSPASRPRELSPDKQRVGNGNGNRAREAKTKQDAPMRGPMRSRSPEKPSLPTITRSSYEQTSPSVAASTSTGSSHTYPSPQTPTSSSPQSNVRGLPRARSSNSLARGAKSSPLRNLVDQPRFRDRGAAMPESFMFDDVLRMKTSAERAQGYVRKINQLAAEDSGLGYWVAFMKGRVRPPGPDGRPPPAGPISPSALLTTFGPHGPGTRRQQPRHVSGGSTTSEATFAVRPDAYVATNISIRAESPPLGPPPALPYPSLARDIGMRSVAPSSSAGVGGGGGLKAKTGAVGFFSSIGRKTSTRNRDRAVMQQARKPHPGAAGGYAELPASARPVQLSAVPTIPGGPRARGARPGAGTPRQQAESIRSVDTGSSGATLNPHPRSSVIMIGGRDSFQTLDASGRPVSIRVPSSNGHGVVVPNLPPMSPSSSPMFGSSPTDTSTIRSGMKSPDGRSSFRGGESGSVYSGRESTRDRESIRERESMRDRESVYGVRGSSVPGHGGNLDQVADVLPHVDRAVLAGYLERADGHEIDAISAYLEDERRANAAASNGGAIGSGGRYI
ncbi:Nascent polypeptide-associated complex subunit alpha, muscle-specific form [Ceratobasidium sp. AG-Ba]|nr:Nascent polypeptide-associated complex subunit alpha, muscle-specific form [Ceratobasidium sp. AG-Ba]